MIIRILIKILLHCKTNGIDIFTEGELFKNLTNKEKYLSTQMFLKKYKLEIYKQSSILETENFMANFYDINKYKIHFEEEFNDLIEINIQNILQY